jgi:hypothetical protein
VFVLALATDGSFALLAAQAGLAFYVAWGMARSLGVAGVGGRPATGGRGRGD